MSENTNTEIKLNETQATSAAPNANTAGNGEVEHLPPTENLPTSATIKIEGQEISLEAEIAADDNLLKAALSPYYPSIRNAQISRETRAGQLIVSIVKKAEHKGSH